MSDLTGSTACSATQTYAYNVTANDTYCATYNNPALPVARAMQACCGIGNPEIVAYGDANSCLRCDIYGGSTHPNPAQNVTAITSAFADCLARNLGITNGSRVGSLCSYRTKNENIPGSSASSVRAPASLALGLLLVVPMVVGGLGSL